MSAVAPPALPAVAPGSGWKGRAAELLLVGGATPLLFVLSFVLRTALGLDAAELAVGFAMFHAAHLLNDPHFAVTYLLFYEDAHGRAFGPSFAPAQRARWWMAGVVVPLILAAWGIGAVASQSAAGIGLLFQLMYLLVGWHYVKQGFGVMTVLAARRGVRFTTTERRAILAHCYAGWAYAWASPFDPGRTVESKGVVFTTFAHPAGLLEITLGLFAASSVALVYVLVRKRLREGRLPLVAPLLALLSSIWAWSVFSAADPLVQYMVPALHSIQYLYFVWLLKRNEGRVLERPPHMGMSARTRIGLTAAGALLLGLVLFDLLPMALDDLAAPAGGFADASLGATPCFAALYAFVNIHHYFMDAVIWRRDNPGTRHLLNDPVCFERADP
jgi:hypothetical protein